MSGRTSARLAPPLVGNRGAHRHGVTRAGGRFLAFATIRKTGETVKGEVVSVLPLTPGKGMGDGVHLELKTDKETRPVHLGPSWYIENQDTRIEVKDVVEDEALRLRDEDGHPAWAGWRRR
jgi:hypothetical protein